MKATNHQITWLLSTNQVEIIPQYQSLDSRERRKLRLGHAVVHEHCGIAEKGKTSLCRSRCHGRSLPGRNYAGPTHRNADRSTSRCAQSGTSATRLSPSFPRRSRRRNAGEVWAARTRAEPVIREIRTGLDKTAKADLTMLVFLQHIDYLSELFDIGTRSQQLFSRRT
jgi:hypothetical protein